MVQARLHQRCRSTNENVENCQALHDASELFSNFYTLVLVRYDRRSLMTYRTLPGGQKGKRDKSRLSSMPIERIFLELCHLTARVDFFLF